MGQHYHTEYTNHRQQTDRQYHLYVPLYTFMIVMMTIKFSYLDYLENINLIEN